jgi:hypothetical protein
MRRTRPGNGDKGDAGSPGGIWRGRSGPPGYFWAGRGEFWTVKEALSTAVPIETPSSRGDVVMIGDLC